MKVRGASTKASGHSALPADGRPDAIGEVAVEDHAVLTRAGVVAAHPGRATERFEGLHVCQAVVSQSGFVPRRRQRT